MDKTVKTREVTHTYIQWTVLLISRSDTVKTPYIPKIKGNKLNCFTKEWSNKQTKQKHINNLNTKIKKKREYILCKTRGGPLCFCFGWVGVQVWTRQMDTLISQSQG